MKDKTIIEEFSKIKGGLKKKVDFFVGKRVTVRKSDDGCVFIISGTLKKELNSYLIREGDVYCVFYIDTLDFLDEFYFNECGVMYFYLK